VDTDTREEMRDWRDQLQKQIADGFTGVHRRQDITNGRIATNERLTYEHGMQLKNLEREVFGRRHDDREQPAAAPDPQGDGRRVSERDVRMVAIGAGALAAIWMSIWKVFPILQKVFHP
jgi:hypothetical protein